MVVLKRYDEALLEINGRLRTNGNKLDDMNLFGVGLGSSDEVHEEEHSSSYSSTKKRKQGHSSDSAVKKRKQDYRSESAKKPKTFDSEHDSSDSSTEKRKQDHSSDSAMKEHQQDRRHHSTSQDSNVGRKEPPRIKCPLCGRDHDEDIVPRPDKQQSKIHKRHKDLYMCPIWSVSLNGHVTSITNDMYKHILFAYESHQFETGRFESGKCVSGPLWAKRRASEIKSKVNQRFRTVRELCRKNKRTEHKKLYYSTNTEDHAKGSSKLVGRPNLTTDERLLWLRDIILPSVLQLYERV